MEVELHLLRAGESKEAFTEEVVLNSILKDELKEFKWDKQVEEMAGGYGWSEGCKVVKAGESRARL